MSNLITELNKYYIANTELMIYGGLVGSFIGASIPNNYHFRDITNNIINGTIVGSLVGIYPVLLMPITYNFTYPYLDYYLYTDKNDKVNIDDNETNETNTVKKNDYPNYKHGYHKSVFGE